MSAQLIFAYGVDGGVLPSIFNYVHKMVSPSTYRCNMCALTYGTFGTKKDWTTFVNTLPYGTQFLHRDEFVEKYPSVKAALPAVFIERDGELTAVVDAATIVAATTLEALMKAIRARVDAVGQPREASTEIQSIR